MGKSKRKDSRKIKSKWLLELHIKEISAGPQDQTSLDKSELQVDVLLPNIVKKKSAPARSATVTDLKRLGGLKTRRPTDYRLLPKHTRKVSRVYGGFFGHNEVKTRIIRTFLTEEVKNVKKTMQMAASEGKKAKKGAKGKGGKGKRVAPVKKRD